MKKREKKDESMGEFEEGVNPSLWRRGEFELIKNGFLNFQLAARPESPESLRQLIEIAKNPAYSGNLSPLAVGKEEIALTPGTKVCRNFSYLTLGAFLHTFTESNTFFFPGTSREEFNET